MSDFTEEQVAALRAPLARENVKERTQAGRTLSYIEGWVAIAEANRIFGFGGWDRETVECKCVSEHPRKIGRDQPRDGWSVSYIAKVRVTVRPTEKFTNPIVREGTGYGSGIDVDVGAAHESAIKEAETDAMKRALMTFGNPFGLALYDKRQAEVTSAQSQAPRAGMVRAADVPRNDARPLAAEPAANGKAATSTEASHTRSANGNGQRKLTPAELFRDAMRGHFAKAETPAAIEKLIADTSSDLARVHKDAPEVYAEIMTDATNAKNALYGETG